MEKGKWRSVCTNSRNWTALDLGVACQQLGFTGGEWHHCKMIVISTRSSLLNHYPHSSQASSLIFNLSPKFVLPLFTSTFLTVVKNKTLQGTSTSTRRATAQPRSRFSTRTQVTTEASNRPKHRDCKAPHPKAPAWGTFCSQHRSWCNSPLYGSSVHREAWILPPQVITKRTKGCVGRVAPF